MCRTGSRPKNGGCGGAPPGYRRERRPAAPPRAAPAPRSPGGGRRAADPRLSPLVERAHAAGLTVHAYTFRRDALPGYARDFDHLLELFLRHPQEVLSRQAIGRHLWGLDFAAGSNVIDVYVRRLRRKLEAGGEPPLLQTVRGAGYALREAPYDPSLP